MKQLLTIVFFLPILFVSGQALDSLRQDSARQARIQLVQGLPSVDFLTSSSYLIPVGQTPALKYYSGISVLNAQRGYVPGLNLGVSPFISSSNRQLVVDGMAFNESSIGSINLNSFEFENAAVFARGNAAAVLGGNAAAGVIALTSKNGKGYIKPTIEVNSFTDMSWADEQTKNRYWYLSNSVAFMQDFGKLDVRVSANNIQQPQNQYAGERPDLNQFKINAGYDITERLSSRVILEHTFSRSEQKYTLYSLGTQNPVIYDQTNRKGYFGGNLTLEYKALDWLKISAQAIENRIFSDLKRESIYSSSIDRNRHAYNLISTAEHQLGDFKGSASVGVSFEEIEMDQSSKSTSSNWGNFSQRLKSNLQRRSAFGSLQVGFRNYAYIQSSARWDDVEFSALPNISNQISLSIGGAFIFSDAFKIPTRFLSSGKVRGTYAKFNGCNCMQYPFIESALSSTNQSTLKKRTETTSTETGIDLTWFKDRLTLTYNYFTGVAANPISPNIVDPSTGFTMTVFNGNYGIRTSGHEIVLGGDVLKTEDWNLHSNFIWSKTETEVISNNTNVSDVVLGGLVRLIAWTPNSDGLIIRHGLYDPSDATMPRNPKPDWTGSWLNQLTYKNISLRVLVDYSKGGYFYASQNQSSSVRGDGTFIWPGVFRDKVGSPLQSEIPYLNNILLSATDYGFSFFWNKMEDMSLIKLREVSIGCQLPSKWLKNAFVSVTGRNLILFYAKAASDPEATYISSPYMQKGVSLNLLAKF